jgi:hypothetical protein
MPMSWDQSSAALSARSAQCLVHLHVAHVRPEPIHHRLGQLGGPFVAAVGQARQGVELVSVDQAALGAQAVQRHVPEDQQRRLVALQRGRTEQLERLAVIAIHAAAVVVHRGQVADRLGMTLHGGTFEPAQCLAEILVDAQSAGVELAEAVLGVGVTLFGGAPVQVGRDRLVAAERIAEVVLACQPVLRQRHTGFGGAREPGGRGGVVSRHDPSVVVHLAEQDRGFGISARGTLLEGGQVTERQLAGPLEQCLVDMVCGHGRRTTGQHQRDQ